MTNTNLLVIKISILSTYTGCGSFFLKKGFIKKVSSNATSQIRKETTSGTQTVTPGETENKRRRHFITMTETLFVIRFTFKFGNPKV